MPVIKIIINWYDSPKFLKNENDVPKFQVKTILKKLVIWFIIYGTGTKSQALEKSGTLPDII